MSTAAATPSPSDSLPSREALQDALIHAADRFQSLVRSLDHTRAGTRIANSDWTAADAAAHVLTVVRRTFQDTRRSQSASDLADLNALCLSEVPEREPLLLSGQLAADIPRMLAVLSRLPTDQPRVFHAGIQTTLQPILAVLLGEFLIHGYDIAVAVGDDWPIDHVEADLLCRGLLPVVGGWLAPQARTANAAWVLRLSKDGAPLVLAITQGAFCLGVPTGTPVLELEVGPGELALAVIYKRRALTDLRLALLSELLLAP